MYGRRLDRCSNRSVSVSVVTEVSLTLGAVYGRRLDRRFHIGLQDLTHNADKLLDNTTGRRAHAITSKLAIDLTWNDRGVTASSERDTAGGLAL